MATRPIGRPREFDHDAVLDAAVELFWCRGYRGTSTRDLEKALSLRPSSLYNAFGSKRGLFDAALDRYQEMTTRALLDPLERTESGLQAVGDFFVALAGWVARDDRGGCMVVNLMAEDGGQTPEFTERSRAYRERVRQALRDCLVRAADAGEIDATDPDGRADLLLGLVLGLNVAARGGAARAEVTRLLEAAKGLVRSWQLAS